MCELARARVRAKERKSAEAALCCACMCCVSNAECIGVGLHCRGAVPECVLYARAYWQLVYRRMCMCARLSA